MIHLTLGQTTGVVSMAAAVWMVRAGTAKKRLEIRVRPRCASCGRQLRRGTCRCAAS